jgi:hypothetical protein
MKITCLHCGLTVTSYLLTKDEALAEISTKFSSHLGEAHPDEQQKLIDSVNAISTISVWLVMVAKHTTLLALPMEKTFNDPVMEQFDLVMDQIQEIMGVEEVEKPEELGDGTTKFVPKKVVEFKNKDIKKINDSVEETVIFPPINLPPTA